MTTLLVMGGAAVGMVLLTAVAVIRMQRSLDRPGGRQGLGSVGDAFGNFIDVFDPGQARAQMTTTTPSASSTAPTAVPAPSGSSAPQVELRLVTRRVAPRSSLSCAP